MRLISPGLGQVDLWGGGTKCRASSDGFDLLRLVLCILAVASSRLPMRWLFMHSVLHRIINSVLMDNVAVEDGCNIQNSVVCPDVCLQVHIPMVPFPWFHLEACTVSAVTCA